MEPKVTLNGRKLTIELPLGWAYRDYFQLVSEAIKDKAWDLSGTHHDDAVRLEKIADSISRTVGD